MTVRAVLLDWGHTLFDTAGSVDFIVEYSSQHGLEVSAEEAFALWEGSRVRSRSAEELAKGRDLSSAVHRACWTDLWVDLEARCPGISDPLYTFETGPQGWSPYVDTRPFLEALQARGIPAVIVSDVPFDLRPILAHYDLEQFIHTFVLSGEHGTIKPQLKLFEIALEAVGVRAAEALMIGDNHVNDGAAIDVGIRALLLPQVAHGQPRGLSAALQLLN
jgi:HAD superfamily hydrolase (TIGR01509 family)